MYVFSLQTSGKAASRRIPFEWEPKITYKQILVQHVFERNVTRTIKYLREIKIFQTIETRNIWSNSIQYV